MGVTRPGHPAAGLGNDVTLHPTDRIRRPWVAETGRALPQVVVDQLLADPVVALGGRELAVPHQGGEDLNGRAGVGVSLGIGVTNE